ncbi:MAG: hypothetical protein AB7P43_15590, partial [Methylocystis sp.]
DSGAGSICKQTASRAAKTCGNDYFRRSQNFVTSTPCEFFTDDRAKAALERIKVQLAPQLTLDADQVERFGAFMRERITTGETTFRKAYLRSIVDAIEVDDKVIRIHGSKASLEQAVIAGEQIGKGVRSFIRKWRAQGESNPCFRRERGITYTYMDDGGQNAAI